MPVPERQLLVKRNQEISVYMLPDGRHLQAEAAMSDSTHEMRLVVKLTYPSLRMVEANIEMPGVPDSLCTEAAKLAKTLVGKHAIPGLKWGAGEKSGNCLLLTDLFRDACAVLSHSLSVASRRELNGLFPGITEEQLFKIWTFARPDMKNTCIRYAEDSTFMCRVDEARWPEGAQELLAGLKKQK